MTATTVRPAYAGTCVDCGEKVVMHPGGHWVSADRDTRRCLGAPEGVVHEVARHVVRVPGVTADVEVREAQAAAKERPA